MLRSPYFDDLKLGDRFKTPGVTITDEAIIDFSLKYDPQYFHMDREAATNSIFGGLVASGFQNSRASVSLGIRQRAIGEQSWRQCRRRGAMGKDRKGDGYN